MHTNFNDICNAATQIYKANFQNNTAWLQTKINSNTSLRNRHLISPHVGDWYEQSYHQNKVMGLQRILDLSNVSSLDICFGSSQINYNSSLSREQKIQI